jgi:hypothetical protein
MQKEKDILIYFGKYRSFSGKWVRLGGEIKNIWR